MYYIMFILFRFFIKDIFKPPLYTATLMLSTYSMYCMFKQISKRKVSKYTYHPYGLHSFSNTIWQALWCSRLSANSWSLPCIKIIHYVTGWVIESGWSVIFSLIVITFLLYVSKIRQNCVVYKNLFIQILQHLIIIGFCFFLHLWWWPLLWTPCVIITYYFSTQEIDLFI